MRYEASRQYKVEVLGLYSEEGEHMWGSEVLLAHLKLKNWPVHNLVDAATRYSDIVADTVQLYLVRWIVANDGRTELDWMMHDDVEFTGGEVLLGPVEVRAEEAEVWTKKQEA